jgi:hypothetical protein
MADRSIASAPLISRRNSLFAIALAICACVAASEVRACPHTSEQDLERARDQFEHKLDEINQAADAADAAARALYTAYLGELVERKCRPLLERLSPEPPLNRDSGPTRERSCWTVLFEHGELPEIIRRLRPYQELRATAYDEAVSHVGQEGPVTMDAQQILAAVIRRVSQPRAGNPRPAVVNAIARAEILNAIRSVLGGMAPQYYDAFKRRECTLYYRDRMEQHALAPDYQDARRNIAKISQDAQVQQYILKCRPVGNVPVTLDTRAPGCYERIRAVYLEPMPELASPVVAFTGELRTLFAELQALRAVVRSEHPVLETSIRNLHSAFLLSLETDRTIIGATPTTNLPTLQSTFDRMISLRDNVQALCNADPVDDSALFQTLHSFWCRVTDMEILGRQVQIAFFHHVDISTVYGVSGEIYQTLTQWADAGLATLQADNARAAALHAIADSL